MRIQAVDLVAVTAAVLEAFVMPALLHRAGMAQPFATAIAVSIALLIVYPVVRKLSRMHGSFGQWAVTVFVIALLSVALHLALLRIHS